MPKTPFKFTEIRKLNARSRYEGRTVKGAVYTTKTQRKKILRFDLVKRVK